MPLMSIPRIKVFMVKLYLTVSAYENGKTVCLKNYIKFLSYYAAVTISLIKSCFIYYALTC